MYVCIHIYMPFLLKLSKVNDDSVNWSWGFLNLAHHSANSSHLCLNVLVHHLMCSNLLGRWCWFLLFQTTFRNPWFLQRPRCIFCLFVLQQNLIMHQKGPLKFCKKLTPPPLLLCTLADTISQKVPVLFNLKVVLRKPDLIKTSEWHPIAPP